MKHVLVAVPDLLFAVQIANAVRAAGAQPLTIRRADDARAHLAPGAETRPDAVIVDLAGRLDAQGVIQTAAAQQIPVFAFGPHLDTDAIRGARAAGAEKVVANSGLAAALPAWLEQQVAGSTIG